MTKKYVTLVGHREANVKPEHKELIKSTGAYLCSQGYHGRSGLADGNERLFLMGYLYSCNTGSVIPFTNYVP